MPTRKKQEAGGHLSILDAVEALETIADLDFEREVDVASEEEINEQNQKVTLRTVKWLSNEDPDETPKLIQETFHVVLEYLKDVYKTESIIVGKPRIVEGVKTIMVLVGEAAQKLDKFTTIFQHTKTKSVKDLKEYKQLQEFYLSRIARKIDEGILGKWILELTKGALAKRETTDKLVARKSISTNYVFIDLESVKKDTEYELFFLRKEDGSRFFNPRLIRNIKLVCDFGESINFEKATDPFLDVKIWQDHAMHVVAKEILRSMGGLLDRYFHETKRSWRREMVAELNKAIMALLMCSNSRNLLRNAPAKSCTEYFKDFHYFLRMALKSREYQRFVVYPPKKSARLAHCILDVSHNLCKGVFTGVHGYQELLPVFEKFFREAVGAQSSEHTKAAKVSKTLWSSLASDYSAIKKYAKQHPNGPLEKVLEILEYGTYHVFDPIGQSNIPYQNYSLYLEEHKMTNIHLPTPTIQEFIHKATIVDEFKGFLRSLSKSQFRRKHLLINLQDKTSWKEHIRCVALEELQSGGPFSKMLDVVTIAKDTEFYNQVTPYQLDNHAEVFIQHFKENLEDENCGYFFPKWIKKKLFPEFIDGVINAVHQVFFGGMNVLTVNNRKDFIEVFYLFLQLKLLEMVQPDSFSFTCKDGIDTGGTSTAQLFAFLKILNDKDYSANDKEHINYILYIAPIILRERVILPEKIDRMIQAIKRIETTKAELGQREFKKMVMESFAKIYNTPILQSLTLVPSL